MQSVLKALAFMSHDSSVCGHGKSSEIIKCQIKCLGWNTVSKGQYLQNEKFNRTQRKKEAKDVEACYRVRLIAN